MRRLFVAASLGADVRRALAEMQQALKARALSLQATPEANLHLTLRFIGACDEEQALRVADWFNRLPLGEMPGAPCALRGWDAFPGREGLTVYAAVQASRELAALQTAAEDGLRKLGFAPETRPFVPHITLARRVRLRQALSDVTAGRGTAFVPAALVLFESRLAPDGPAYLPLVVRQVDGAGGG